MFEIAGLVLLGLVAGTVAAALGLGGGIVFVPVLVVVFGFDQHLAQGTSLAVILPTAVMATLAHARMGNVRWNLAIPIGLAGTLSAVLGAQIALHLDADLLQRLFGTFLIILACRMVWHAWRVNGRLERTPDPS
jgi:uncharacterized membrane protein YfcA